MRPDEAADGQRARNRSMLVARRWAALFISKRILHASGDQTKRQDNFHRKHPI